MSFEVKFFLFKNVKVLQTSIVWTQVFLPLLEFNQSLL